MKRKFTTKPPTDCLSGPDEDKTIIHTPIVLKRGDIRNSEIEESRNDVIRRVFHDSRKTIHGRTMISKMIPAVRLNKRGILRSNHVLNIIEKKKIDPFNVVSKNLSEQSASVFERYKHLAKRGK
ncbi:hypothetical protein RB620_11435 [Paenibacillus sp. LHD-117]|uniref:hypothetical protein n=1 Tax=Paenibacillus sp. LHD-117 TaxID=3071412 RepID=UPI0027E18821|nr:hypothetical protein [Paenibacillus sp. LHD-117]MDQ6420048.1 hypothetical protein [Paenibacillus sp. LHD-117]